jgi:beta-N-acetylhexosaminidase
VDARPAGFSQKWLQDILRAQMGFTGAIFSDDLSMEAATLIDGKKVSYTHAAKTALNAGCDMVLLCNQSVGDEGKAVDELIEGLSRAVDKGEVRLSEASDARRVRLLPQTAPLNWDELVRDERYHAALKALAGL